MAKYKETITQVDFGVGSPRKEAVEREDTALVSRSLKEAENTLTLTTGALRQRPGLVHVNAASAEYGEECDLGNGRVYDLQIREGGLTLRDEAGSIVFTTSITWAALPTVYGSPSFEDMHFWSITDPDTSSILIGSQYTPIYAVVRHSASLWSVGQLAFSETLSGALAIPYFQYHRGISILPSAQTGVITVTASSPIWTAAHNGTSIRYEGREILLGSLVSTSVINATVIEALPPTYELTVGSVTGFQVGEAVESETNGSQGYIVDITGSVITVIASDQFDAFSGGGQLIGPKATTSISSEALVSPAASFNWDMQLMSKVNGYAGWGEKHKGRVYLCDFPNAPQVFAVSRAGYIDDFTMGVNDGDGFVESLGANYGGDLRYIISGEDLLFFTTAGIYYQQTRDGSDITPTTIGPVRFSRVAAARVAPVAIDDGVVFVDNVGGQVYAALLSGDVYRSWLCRNVSEFHAQLITGPRHLGATSAGSVWPEQFIFVTNEDGTVAVCQWEKDENIFGWRPWSTVGKFLSVYQVFGKVYAIVDRDETVPNAFGFRTEMFHEEAFVDAMGALYIDGDGQEGTNGVSYFGGVTAGPLELAYASPAAYIDGWDYGDHYVDFALGNQIDEYGNRLTYPYPGYPTIVQIGLPFTVRVTPWPRRSVQTQRGTRQVKRQTHVGFTVQDTLGFTFEGREFGGYRAGEDLTVPPPLRSEEAMFITGGRGAFEVYPMVHERPGPITILKIKHRVVV